MKNTTLTTIRKAESLSKAAIAARLQISRDTWGDYEMGKRPIPSWLALAVTCVYRRLEPLE
jgi:DNA-binding XRE family transcriptional regulator